MFQSELSPSKFQRQQLIEACELSSLKVTKCIKDIIKVTPAINTQKRKYIFIWIPNNFIELIKLNDSIYHYAKNKTHFAAL